MTSNLEIVKESYESFAQDDLDTMFDFLAEDIMWIVAEGGPYGGTYRGPDEVHQRVIQPTREEWDSFRVEPKRFIDCGDTIVVTGTYSGTYSATDKSFEAPFAHVLDLEDGAIIRFQQYTDTVLFNQPLKN